mmetsp:Transcript_11652/g.36970  ORF Transcript_11652/g.36970 Transcript_11652/m.36970 type:complete len:93 (+) Transcript_11652:313-591(+)
MRWGGRLVMVGPYGDCIQYEYAEAPLLFPEQDCARVVTSSATELLLRVSPVAVAVLAPAATAASAGARLLAASCVSVRAPRKKVRRAFFFFY